MKDHDPSIESAYLMHWDVNNLHEWAILRKLPVDEDTINSTSMKTSQKSMLKTVTKYISLRLMLIILRNYRRHTVTSHSYHKEIKFKRCQKLVRDLHDKKKYVTYKSPETDARSWTDTTKSTYDNRT